MNFAERNVNWQGEQRMFQQPNSRSGVPRVWTVEVVGNKVVTGWGQLGGKMQSATEAFSGVNVGKANAMSPSEYALDRAREMCRKKGWEGYLEMGPNGYMDPISQSEIDFTQPLPLNLSFYKPDNSLSAALDKKARGLGCWYTRKRNGMMKVLVKDDYGELKIYSRRMLRQHDDEVATEYTWDDRFPHIISAIEPHIPPRTILLGEMVVEENGVERFDLAQSYIKSLTPKAVREMDESKLYPFFYGWDVAFWNGQNLVANMAMRDRVQYLDTIEMEASCQHFEALVRLSFPTPEHAVEFAKEQGWEGFVVIDPDAIYGDKAFNFKGKPDRPGKACGKLKPTFEDDFIAIWDPENGFGERSQKGSRAGGIKSVGLYQYNTKGELIFIANVNSGLTKELLATLPSSKWPQVWRCEYKGRRYVSDGDDTNALDFPALPEGGIRTDKEARECINPRL